MMQNVKDVKVITIMDPGYSNFKFAFVNTETLRSTFAKIPSAVSELPEWQLETLPKGITESSAIEWNNKKYIIGNEALFSGLPIPPFAKGWLENIAIPLFAKKYAQNTLELIVLLSPSDWTLKNEITQNLQSAGFSSFRFVPQGVGIWLDAGAPKNAVIIDIGFNTVDVLIAQDGKIIRELCFSLKECGLVSFLERVARDDPFLINRKLEENDPYLTKLAKEHYWEWLERQLSARSEWRRINLNPNLKLIIGGGGAHFLPDDFNKGYITREPELSNVKGIAKVVVKELKKKQQTIKSEQNIELKKENTQIALVQPPLNKKNEKN